MRQRGARRDTRIGEEDVKASIVGNCALTYGGDGSFVGGVALLGVNLLVSNQITAQDERKSSREALLLLPHKGRTDTGR